jgi:hypothetical protein
MRSIAVQVLLLLGCTVFWLSLRYMNSWWLLLDSFPLLVVVTKNGQQTEGWSKYK